MSLLVVRRVVLVASMASLKATASMACRSVDDAGFTRPRSDH